MSHRRGQVWLVRACCALLAVAIVSGLARGLAFPPPEAAADGTTTVYITRTGSHYHRAGCQYLSKSCIPISLKEAVQRGELPCSRCKPPTLDDPED